MDQQPAMESLGQYPIPIWLANGYSREDIDHGAGGAYCGQKKNSNEVERNGP